MESYSFLLKSFIFQGTRCVNVRVGWLRNGATGVFTLVEEQVEVADLLDQVDSFLLGLSLLGLPYSGAIRR